MTLHIYGQLWEHDSSYIIGTKEELLNLAELLKAAAENSNKSISISSFTNDGEGYTLSALALSEDDMNTIRLPYSDESMGFSREGILAYQIIRDRR